MFIEKINEELLEEIREALYEEYDQNVTSWDGEIIDLENDDFEDMLRSEIFSDYFNIPLRMLNNMINQYYPFLEEKKINIDPCSEIAISENDENKEVYLRVSVDHYAFEKEILSDSELKQLDKLIGELTLLYDNLELETTLYISELSLEDVPEEYYEDGEDHNFVQIEF